MERDETPSAPASQSPIPEPDEVCYKFGGAAIADMLNNRYGRIHSCPENNRGSITVEISILKSMQCPDKSIVPPSLQYQDRFYVLAQSSFNSFHQNSG